MGMRKSMSMGMGQAWSLRKLFGTAFVEGVGSAVGSVLVYGLIVIFVLKAYSSDKSPKENLQQMLQLRSTGGGSMVLQNIPGVGTGTGTHAGYA